MGRTLEPVNKPRDIRFLTVVSSLTRGGTERAAVNYTLGYHGQGMPCAVLAYGGGGPRRSSLDDRGIPVFVGGDSPQAQALAIEQARSWAPDILHVHRPGLHDSQSATILASLLHPRLRVFETNVFGYVDDSDDRELFDLHLLLSRWCLKKWEDGSDGLERRSPGVVIPNPTESSSFWAETLEQKAALRSDFGIPSDAVVFGRVGQPLTSKWSPILIDSFRVIADKFADAYLVVVGLPQALQAQVEALPASLRSRVRQLPLVNNDSELMRYYGLMDVFVHASDKGESFGMVLCEAMLCGLPVITLSTPLRDNSQIEVIRHGETGLVVSDQRGFIEAMAALHSDRNLREKMSHNCPDRAKRAYDIPVVAAPLVELARLALAASSSRELAGRLARDSRYITAPGQDTYQTLLRSAGITASMTETLLLATVNRPLTRRAVRLVRSMQQRVRTIMKQHEIKPTTMED